jgi:hypothetical protein
VNAHLDQQSSYHHHYKINNKECEHKKATRNVNSPMWIHAHTTWKLAVSEVVVRVMICSLIITYLKALTYYLKLEKNITMSFPSHRTIGILTPVKYPKWKSTEL